MSRHENVRLVLLFLVGEIDPILFVDSVLGVCILMNILLIDSTVASVRYSLNFVHRRDSELLRVPCKCLIQLQWWLLG